MRTALALVIAAASAVGPVARTRPAAADPAGPRVLTAPTAWLPRAGTAAAMLSVDHRGDRAAVVSYGLGDLAEVDLGSDSDIRACTDCARRPVPAALGRAAFRLGVRQHAWFPGMPALVLGVRTSFAARGHAVHGARASDAYVVASRDLGVVRAHLGIAAIAAGIAGARAPATLRPLAALEIHPPMYPRSSLLADIAWEPILDAQRGPTLEWLLGIGVRYQAFRWASAELAVRVREAEDLGASTVMLRVNAVLERGPSTGPRSDRESR